eukprot:m51a1_g6848 putative adenylate guanylate cyclase (521) ;mRNA; r:91412-93979
MNPEVVTHIPDESDSGWQVRRGRAKLSPEEARERRLERNRQAARQFRKRQLDYQVGLERTVAQLRAERRALGVQVDTLTRELHDQALVICKLRAELQGGPRDPSTCDSSGGVVNLWQELLDVGLNNPGWYIGTGDRWGSHAGVYGAGPSPSYSRSDPVVYFQRQGFWNGILISFYALPNATGHWQLMDTTGQNMSVFDTRDRPWYKSAAEHPTGEHLWGDVYLAVPEGYLCTAVSRMWARLDAASTDENHCGVAAALMGLTEISLYLQTHRLGQTHVRFVSLDDDRNIIASSTSALIGRTEPEGTMLRIPIELSEDRLTRGVGSATRRMHDGQFRKASVASKDYYLYTEIVDVRPGMGFPTIGVIVAVEVSAYFADIQKSTLLMAIIAAVLAVVSVLLSTMFSVLISRPLRVIVRQMDRISRLESARYLGSLSKVANLSEIDSIDNSMQRMSIINSFHKYVPLQVLKLLLKNGEIAQLHVSRHKCSIMFCDIENFTPLTASTGPEVLLRVFTDFMDICTE